MMGRFWEMLEYISPVSAQEVKQDKIVERLEQEVEDADVRLRYLSAIVEVRRRRTLA